MSTIVENSKPIFPIGNQVPDVTQESPGFCARVKNFSLGVASAGIIVPISTGASYLAGKVGIIPEFDRANLMNKTVANYVKLGYKLNHASILNAACPKQELLRQISPGVPDKDLPLFAITIAKGMKIGLRGISVPIIEELLFRGLIQDVLLTRLPKYVISKITPGQETALDTNIAKAARIGLTAALFSACHLQNAGVLADSYIQMQLVSTFVGGIGLGLLKESSAGLLGAMGAHITNNMIAIAPNLWSC